MKPHLAISCGDPAGISYEVVLRSFLPAHQAARLVLFGHWPTFAALQRQFPSDDVPEIELVDRPPRTARTVVQFVSSAGPAGPIDGPGLDNANAQLEALQAATDAVLDGTCDALVTAPVCKSEIARIQPDFVGHTEYLAQRCALENDDVTMVFASDNLTVGLVATHVPFRDIPDTLTPKNLHRTLKHIVQITRALRDVALPHIGVAALNPHAGEDCLLGLEEHDILTPFCRAFDDLNDIQIFGPIPADTLFRDALAGKYHGVIAAYHDQAMIPLKLTGTGATVNITAGLPFVRTSPDHGVARDIARTGRADPRGMQGAIATALRLIPRP